MPIISRLPDSPSAYDVESWVRENFSYRPENEEVLRSVPWMLQEWRSNGAAEGDCDDAAILTAAILRALGIASRFVAIRFATADPEFRHVFIEADNGLTWLPIDVTVPEGTNHVQIERMVFYVF